MSGTPRRLTDGLGMDGHEAILGEVAESGRLRLRAELRALNEGRIWPNADERAELVPMPDASWMRPDFASPSLAPILDGDFYPGVAGLGYGFI